MKHIANSSFSKAGFSCHNGDWKSAFIAEKPGLKKKKSATHVILLQTLRSFRYARVSNVIITADRARMTSYALIGKTSDTWAQARPTACVAGHVPASVLGAPKHSQRGRFAAES